MLPYFQHHLKVESNQPTLALSNYPSQTPQFRSTLAIWADTLPQAGYFEELPELGQNNIESTYCPGFWHILCSYSRKSYFARLRSKRE